MKVPYAHMWPMMAILVGIIAVTGPVNASESIAAITDPSADVTLSFLTAGRIAEILVKEGDVIKKGELLIRQDDTVEQTQLVQLLAESEDTNQIDAAQATLQQKKIDLKRLEWAAQRGAATDLEVQHSRLDVRIGELSLKVAQFEHTQARRKYETALMRVENMRLKSPVSGAVELVHYEVGESVNGLEDVIRIVSTDPLLIDAPVPLKLAKSLKVKGDTTVRFSDTPGESLKGQIIFIATAADAASSTLRVRIMVPNPDARPSGEHVRVIFGGSKEQQRAKHENSATIPERYSHKY